MLGLFQQYQQHGTFFTKDYSKVQLGWNAYVPHTVKLAFSEGGMIRALSMFI